MKSDELAIYLTVLPFYRQACMETLTDLSPNPVALFAGPHQLGGSVRTGIGKELYTPLRSLTVSDVASTRSITPRTRTLASAGPGWAETIGATTAQAMIARTDARALM